MLIQGMELTAIALVPGLFLAAEVQEYGFSQNIVHIADIVGHYFVILIVPNIIVVQLLIHTFYLFGIEGINDVLIGHDELCTVLFDKTVNGFLLDKLSLKIQVHKQYP
jgi:hypothetical protein